MRGHVRGKNNCSSWDIGRDRIYVAQMSGGMADKITEERSLSKCKENLSHDMYTKMWSRIRLYQIYMIRRNTD